MGKEEENLRMIFDLQREPSERADDQEEEAPLEEADAREDHQAHQEADHQEDHPKETTTEIGMILKEITKAVILLGRSTATSTISMEIEQKLANSRTNSE